MEPMSAGIDRKSTSLGVILNIGAFNFEAMASTHKLLNGVLAALLLYNAAFFVLHLGGEARMWKSVFQDVQAILNILELIAVVSLFVDLVVRFDQITPSLQVPRVVGVGLCVTGLLFKWFVLYLHLSYLVD